MCALSADTLYIQPGGGVLYLGDGRQSFGHVTTGGPRLPALEFIFVSSKLGEEEVSVTLAV